MNQVELEEDLEVVVHSLIRDLPVSAIRMEQIRDATIEDPELQRLRQAVMIGWPKNKQTASGVLQSFWAVKEEVHIAEGMLLAGDRII